uniref:Uncharacterized protein n=1 Tax=Anguilla anguilla TaxID=7936 RepID=A0A0E9R4U2_ANGAN
MNWYRKQYWLDCSKMYMCTSTRLSGHSVCRENFYFPKGISVVIILGTLLKRKIEWIIRMIKNSTWCSSTK